MYNDRKNNYQPRQDAKEGRIMNAKNFRIDYLFFRSSSKRQNVKMWTDCLLLLSVSVLLRRASSSAVQQDRFLNKDTEYFMAKLFTYFTSFIPNKVAKEGSVLCIDQKIFVNRCFSKRG